MVGDHMGIRGAVGFIFALIFALPGCTESWKLSLILGTMVFNFGDDGFEFWGRWVWILGTMGLNFGDDGFEYSGRWSLIFGTMGLNFRDDGL